MLTTESSLTPRPKIGVSACLLGRPVRYNGGHCRTAFVAERLAALAELEAVCPEMGVGMGAPRETIRLEKDADGNVLLRASKSGKDWTAEMDAYARWLASEMAQRGISGFIVKKDSPTCGMERVKVYDVNGAPSRTGEGVFAAALRRAMPLLPIEEEGRLNDSRLRENFFMRVFAYQRLQRLFGLSWTLGELVAFHTAEKLLLLAHDPARYRSLGRLIAGAKGVSRERLEREYSRMFMDALARPASVRRQVNTLEHVLGFLKRRLDSEDKRELLRLIDDFRRGLTPLETPLTLIRHYVRRLKIAYIDQQTYLQPHPKDLALRATL